MTSQGVDDYYAARLIGVVDGQTCWEIVDPRSLVERPTATETVFGGPCIPCVVDFSRRNKLNIAKVDLLLENTTMYHNEIVHKRVLKT